MKNEVKHLLKENKRSEIFTEERYGVLVEFMKLSAKRDRMLKGLFESIPDSKAKFVADHMVRFVDEGKL